MNRNAIVFFTLIAIAIASASTAVLIADAPSPGLALPVDTITVVDGDTVDVHVTLIVRVRLDGCWAPESYGKKKIPEGTASKEALRAIANGCAGYVSIPLKSSRLSDILTLDRVVGQVWIDGDKKSLSEHQILSGHAFATRAELVAKYPSQKKEDP